MCSDQGTHMSSAKAVKMSLLHHDARREPLAELSCFRDEFYSCLTARSDALFELADAVLCGDGPVRSLAELSLVGNTAAAMAGSSPLWPVDALMPAGCGGYWLKCRCRGLPMAGWSWPSMSPAG